MNTPTKHELNDGIIEWRLSNGKRHRTDGPALIFPNGTNAWYQYDKFHREDGPAIIYSDGIMKWYINGVLHRTDGPAVIYSEGVIIYYIDGIEYDPLTFLMKSYEYTN